jgi:hypothetical protein
LACNSACFPPETAAYDHDFFFTAHANPQRGINITEDDFFLAAGVSSSDPYSLTIDGITGISPRMEVPIGVPLLYWLFANAFRGYQGGGSGRVDFDISFGGSFSFATDGPVLELPPGYTVHGTGIVVKSLYRRDTRAEDVYRDLDRAIVGVCPSEAWRFGAYESRLARALRLEQHARRSSTRWSMGRLVRQLTHP